MVIAKLKVHEFIRTVSNPNVIEYSTSEIKINTGIFVENYLREFFFSYSLNIVRNTNIETALKFVYLIYSITVKTAF